MKLLELMFCDPQTELAVTLSCVTEQLSDLQAWPELSEVEKADLFGKLIGTRQAIDHCLQVNFKCEPDLVPRRLEDVLGADSLSPWNLPSSRPPAIDKGFLDSLGDLLNDGGAQ